MFFSALGDAASRRVALLLTTAAVEKLTLEVVETLRWGEAETLRWEEPETLMKREAAEM